MLSLQSSLILNHSSYSPCLSFNRFKCGINFQKLPGVSLFSVSKASYRTINVINKDENSILLHKNIESIDEDDVDETVYNSTNPNIATIKLYAILEAVCDRIEMHNNIGQQRDNWNKLLLNSINLLTLTASTMTAIACCSDDDKPLLALKLSSSLLFSAATGMILVMNKIQPSQLVEEQRNATRLFKQLHTQIQTKISLCNNNHSECDVRDVIERILALDKAYPLPLLGGKMLEKFPSKFEASKWWACQRKMTRMNNKMEINESDNGWNLELENEMKEIIEVVKRKDIEDYERLGNIALKINKSLSILGALLTGTATVGCFFVGGDGMLVNFVPVFGGALATVVNSFQHGGQVGMVFEMYRNCGGFFKLLEEMVEETIEEKEMNKRENGEMLEMRIALSLGRSVMEIRELASKSASYRVQGREIDEFANKLF